MPLIVAMLGLILGILLFMGGFIGTIDYAKITYPIVDAFYTYGDVAKIPFDINYTKVDLNSDLNKVTFNFGAYALCEDGIYRIDQASFTAAEISNYYYDITGKFMHKYLFKVETSDQELTAYKISPSYDNTDLFIEDLLTNYVYETALEGAGVKTVINPSGCYLIADQGSVTLEYYVYDANVGDYVTVTQTI